MKTETRTKQWRIDIDDKELLIDSIKKFKKQYKVDRVIILKDMYNKEYIVTIYFQNICEVINFIDVTDEFKDLI